jgi:hypothetical protein
MSPYSSNATETVPAPTGSARALMDILAVPGRGSHHQVGDVIGLAIQPRTAFSYVQGSTEILTTVRPTTSPGLSIADHWLRYASMSVLEQISPAWKISAIRNDLTLFVCKSPLQRIPYPHPTADLYGNLLLRWDDVSERVELRFDGSGTYDVRCVGDSLKVVPSSQGLEGEALRTLTDWEKGPPRPSWVTALEHLGQARPTTAVLSALVDTIFDLMSEQRFALLDRAFRGLDVARVSADALVALLRLTYSGRTEIASWASLLERARVELDGRGVNTKLELVGLAVDANAEQSV